MCLALLAHWSFPHRQRHRLTCCVPTTKQDRQYNQRLRTNPVKAIHDQSGLIGCRLLVVATGSPVLLYPSGLEAGPSDPEYCPRIRLANKACGLLEGVVPGSGTSLLMQSSSGKRGNGPNGEEALQDLHPQRIHVRLMHVGGSLEGYPPQVGRYHSSFASYSSTTLLNPHSTNELCPNARTTGSYTGHFAVPTIALFLLHWIGRTISHPEQKNALRRSKAAITDFP